MSTKGAKNLSRVVNLFATDIHSRNLLWCDDVLHKPVSQLPYVNLFSLTHRKATSTSILLHSLSALMSALKPILKWQVEKTKNIEEMKVQLKIIMEGRQLSYLKFSFILILMLSCIWVVTLVLIYLPFCSCVLYYIVLHVYPCIYLAELRKSFFEAVLLWGRIYELSYDFWLFVATWRNSQVSSKLMF